MSSDGGAASTAPRGRGRGRGRGTNRGKAMRARGRRGVGRGAVFNERLVLEGEASTEMTEEEAEELQMKYARRGLGSNADRYLEPEKTEEEAEEDEYDYDLAEVREKQREQEIEAGEVSVEPNEKQDTEYEDDVDHTLAHISSKSLDLSAKAEPKRSMQTIEWDPGLDEMRREIDKAEGMRDLKERFRTKSEKLLRPTSTLDGRATKAKKGQELKAAPTLESMLEDPKTKPPANEEQQQAEMEGFLDDLLA